MALPDATRPAATQLVQCQLASSAPFAGREAVEKARAAGPRQWPASLVLADPDVMMRGGELVLRDGVPVGQVTSAAWGAMVGGGVALADIARPDGDVAARDFVTSGAYCVNVGRAVVPAATTLRSPYDPAGARIRPAFPSAPRYPAREQRECAFASLASAVNAHSPCPRTSQMRVHCALAGVNARLPYW